MIVALVSIWGLRGLGRSCTARPANVCALKEQEIGSKINLTLSSAKGRMKIVI